MKGHRPHVSVASNLIGQYRPARCTEGSDNLDRNPRRRIKVRDPRASLGNSALKVTAISQIDDDALGGRRAHNGHADEPKEYLQIQDASQHLARLAHRSLIVRLRAIDVAIEESTGDIACNRCNEGDDCDRGEKQH